MSIFKDNREQEPKEHKLIDDIKTLDELMEYYYIISKATILDDNIRDELEDVTLKAKEKTNINLVRRGKRKKRISEEQQEEIRRSKKTNEELSKVYNVSPSTISNIKNNKY